MTLNKGGSEMCSSSEPCEDPYFVCDTFTSQCIPCSAICRDDFDKCHNKCGVFIQSVLFKENIEKTDIYNLTVMVAVTTAMTLVILVCLGFLVLLKLRKRGRRKKGILPALYTVDKEKCSVEMPRPVQLEVRSLHRRSTGSSPENVLTASKQLGSSFQSSPPALNNGISLQTVTTQLSDESTLRHGVQQRDGTAAVQLGVGGLPQLARSSGGHTSSQSSVFDRKTRSKRKPSEDCVLGGKYNQGLDQSSDSNSQVV